MKQNCLQACHGGEYQATLSAYNRLKGTTALGAACNQTPRIIVNSGATSLVVKKMLGTAGCGSRMPLVGGAGCNGNTCVLMTDITKISQWIDQGALNN